MMTSLKNNICLVITALVLTTTSIQAQSQSSFFRISSTDTAVITSISSSGQLTWRLSNPNTTCSVQVATSLTNNGNWRDHFRIYAVSTVVTARAFAMSPPDQMGFIPGGLFRMGDTCADSPTNVVDQLNETPTHIVRLNSFYMGKHEVTKSEWDIVREWALSNGYSIACVGTAKGTNHPVVAVCWHDAVKWCNARSEKEGLSPCYYSSASQTTLYRTGTLDLASTAIKQDAQGYRLPFEAEWEYAARGGGQTNRFPQGNTLSHTGANYYSSASYSWDISPTRNLHPGFAGDAPCTSPVGVFSPNGYGLYDLAGNASEWCWDYSDGCLNNCSTCSGSGNTSCPTCTGHTFVTCPKCIGGMYFDCDNCASIGRIICNTCNNAGPIVCWICDGDGTITATCPACNGMDAECPDCAGMGEIEEPCSNCDFNHTATCYTCNGAGETSCPACNELGQIDCDQCHAIGTVSCQPCSGTGGLTCNTCHGVAQLWSSTYYATAQDNNPQGPPNGTERVVRGGNWDSTAYSCRLANRTGITPTESLLSTGFRVVRSTSE